MKLYDNSPTFELILILAVIGLFFAIVNHYGGQEYTKKLADFNRTCNVTHRGYGIVEFNNSSGLWECYYNPLGGVPDW